MTDTGRRIGQIDARYMTHSTRTHSSGDPCPVGPFPHPAEPACLDRSRTYVIDWTPGAELPPPMTPDEEAASLKNGGVDNAGRYRARVPDDAPAGATVDDDPEGFAVELVAEYAAAIERVRDRAQEARAGGRYLTRHPIARRCAMPRDLAELVRRDRRDRINWTAATQQLAALAAGPIRDTPIGRAGLDAHPIDHRHPGPMRTCATCAAIRAAID